jgi:hypothetical protein
MALPITTPASHRIVHGPFDFATSLGNAAPFIMPQSRSDG